MVRLSAWHRWLSGRAYWLCLVVALICFVLVAHTLAEEAQDGLPPLLTTAAVQGPVDRPIPLRILAPVTVNNEGTMVLIANVPQHARLNAGLRVAKGEWLMTPDMAREVTLTASHAGVFRLEVNLMSETLHTVAAPTFLPVKVSAERGW